MVLNCQKRVAVKPRALDRFFYRVAALLRLPSSSATICLVTDAKIASWNRAYRGNDRPTDVLSFPAAIQTQPKNGNQRLSQRIPRGTKSSYLGDIAIAPGVARRNARAAGRSFDDEMKLLTLHGLLHLMGYDHETDNGVMERLEMRLRRRLGLA